jgi:diguanylate cyclase (GGDEF)-like protein
MSSVSKGSADRIVQLADENALLRASLSDMRQRVAELEHVADSDTVTPLPNRRRFLREIERVVGSANRHGTPSALVAIEIGNLRTLNDLHGEMAGDAALIHVAKLLSGLIRSTDFAARIDGDDFGLILDHLDHNSAIETAERIARCIAENMLDLGHATVPLKATVGVATILPGDSVRDVLQRAEHNIRRAKYGD